MSLPENLKDKSLFKPMCLVNGEWFKGEGIEIKNPAIGEIIARLPLMGANEAEEAVSAANEAFKTWSKLIAKDRSKILRKWFDLIMANQEDLALILTTEQGKPLSEAMGEIAYAASFIEFYAEEATRIEGEIIQSPNKNARIMVLKQPLGVVAAISPWNFPSAMIAKKLGAALAAGCTVVCKPSELTPLSAFALAELGIRAGLPKGTINMIIGDAPAIGKVWCASNIVRGLSFTGSTNVGKILMRQSADTVKKLGLELGGNAAFIVFDDADINAAIEGVMASKFRNTGQTCICANRILVQESIHDVFTEKLRQRISELKVGNGITPGITQGPLINNAAIEKIESHINDAVEKGAKILLGGKRHDLGGQFFEPTLLINANNNMLLAKEETFGPLAPIFKFKTEQDAIDMCNDTEYGLSSYFYARDLGRVYRVMENIEAGIVAVNSGAASNEIAPFGGIKQSGLGREGSKHGLEEYLELKYIYLGLPQ